MFKKLLNSLLFGTVRCLLALRYRLEISGTEKLSAEKKGYLFLPNHPAELDPVMMMLVLEKFHPRPLVVEHFFYLKGVTFFMDWVGAIPFPNLALSVNKWKARRVDKILHQVAEELKKGSNFLIYPSGRLKGSEKEVLGGASFIPNLLEACPEANVVLIRTTGMWGSLFSKAPTGASPDFGKTLFRCLKILLKNGIFFTPRRLVKIEVAPAPSDFPLGRSKMEINGYLERWYNTPPDSLKTVPFYFWKKEAVEVISKKEVQESLVYIPKEIEETVLNQLAKLSRRPVESFKRESLLAQDLGFDSLDMAELSVFLEERYDISNLAPGTLLTVQDLLSAAAGYKKDQVEETLAPEDKKLLRWRNEGSRPEVMLPGGKTLQEVFLLSCDRMGSALACADQLTGILTYRQLKVAALALSRKIAAMPGTNIGIMLPASVGVYLVILATLLAKKVPVMLNWTAGERSLDHSMDLAQVETVLSSLRFLSRLENGDLGKLEDKIVFLEDLRREITLKEKIRAWAWGFYKTPTLIKKLGFTPLTEDDTAVILFTSGTETLPKGVPLSHKNILSNQRGAISVAGIKSQDILLGFLPPFHSFGFSATGLLPLLSGLRAYFAPDPTNGRALAFDIQHWRPTMLCSAPGFINQILRAAPPGALASLRLVVSGAEKTPQDLFDKIAALGTQAGGTEAGGTGAKLLEGYGITECSPIVTLDRLEEPHKGVGYPLPGVELAIIHPETGELQKRGEEGEVCIAGPNVFNGYLSGTARQNPFILLQGKQWYRSGDRGWIDSDGALILTGRLKRFVKIGGEMLSLSGMEEDLLQMVKEKNWTIPSLDGPPLAIIAKKNEEMDKMEVILFTTLSQSKEEMNGLLREKGSSRIAKITEVKKVEQIPLTGTGKTHYRLLEEWNLSQN